MKKKDLEAHIELLREEIKNKELVIRTLIQAGVGYKRQFDEAYLFMKKIPGLQSHPLWEELQGLLQKYDVIHHPTFGTMPVLKSQES